MTVSGDKHQGSATTDGPAGGELYQELSAALEVFGLKLRGGLHLEPGEWPLADGRDCRTVVLVGNFGPQLWPNFRAGAHDTPNPLDDWSKAVVGPIAAKFGALDVHPNDRPFAPFQQWAMRAEPVAPSPIGLLIHPRYGLWHAYRAALLFDRKIEIPARIDQPSPCASCRDRPCLADCPVGAFSGRGYDVQGCATHLRSPRQTCMTGGCRARAACPIGAPPGSSDGYTLAQVQFHMAAFLRSRA